MENELVEESLDSIPQPEYEAIEGRISGKSTPSTNEMPGNEEEKILNRIGGIVVADNQDALTEDDAGEDEDEQEDDYDDGIEYGEANELIEDDLVGYNKQVEHFIKPSDHSSYTRKDGEAIGNVEAKFNRTDGMGVVEDEMVDQPQSRRESLETEKSINFEQTAKDDIDPLLNSPTAVIAKQLAITKVVPAKIKNASGNEMELQETLTSSKLMLDEDKSHTPTKQRTGRSTPLSRELMSLHQSQIESKLLSEWVNVRKRRKSGPNKDNFPEQTPVEAKMLNEWPHARKRRKSGSNKDNFAERISQKHDEIHLVERSKSDTINNSSHCHSDNAMPRKMGKFMPLKDDPSDLNNFSKIAKRSRSKSVSRKSPDIVEMRLKRWPSDEKILKRTNMRSQNSEFVQKQMEFLNRITREDQDGSELDDESFINAAEEDDTTHFPESSISEGGNTTTLSGGQPPTQAQTSLIVESNNSFDADSSVNTLEARLKAIWQPPPKRGWDSFCWKCRDCSNLIPCSKCVRSFHSTCVKITANNKLDDTWTCPECLTVENVLNGPKRTRLRNELSLDLLSQLLSFALKRMRNVKGYSKSMLINGDLAPYSKYIVNPVTFATLHEKIEKRAFRCAEEFLNETKWMLHNASILSFGASNSKETLTAKSILKICRQETNEIDTCAECYLNANTRADWFVDVCAQPHLLVWAKLKGFPYWPAKAMGLGQGSHVNVRFFGEHDRAFVPVKDCFLYSIQDPNTQTGKRSARELADCIKEVEVHIEKIKTKVGDFKYANYKTPYDPSEEMQQLEDMMPGVTEYMKRQQMLVANPPLQYKIVKTADNHLSIVKKASAPESGNDSDHSSSPNKKKHLENCDADAGCKSKLSTTKYEVVSKATSDDSNSSKVSAVILKRKSDGTHDNRKRSEEPETVTPKMTRIEDLEERKQMVLNANSGGVSGTTSGKKKHGTEATHSDSSTDSVKHKSKHAKHEPKIPMLTIKTSSAKVAETTSKHKNAESEAQHVVKSIVKNKQGVTIKKITKELHEDVKKDASENNGNKIGKGDTDTCPSTEVISTTTTTTTDIKPSEGVGMKVAAVPAEKVKAANEEMNSKTEKSKSSQKPVAILKDLVPFVEIKKEINSDDEENAADFNAGVANIDIQKNPSTTTVIATTKTSSTPSTTSATATTTTLASSSMPASLTQSAVGGMPLATVPDLSVVKQEVMSDDEGQFAVNERNKDNGASNSAQNLSTTLPQVDKVAAGSLIGNDTVRVVGDTTIQRLSTKNANAQQNLNSSLPATGQISSSAVVAAANNAAKRVPSRGIPYGPLPASATSNSASSKAASNALNVAANPSNSSYGVVFNPQQQQQQQNAQQLQLQQQQQQLQQQQLRQTQRARKSFLNRSPPATSPARNTPIPSTTAAAAAAASMSAPPAPLPAGANDVKRSLLKTSMVSIPRQAWSTPSEGLVINRNHTNSIPVPPLTAVSKTVPSASSALASTASPSNTNSSTLTSLDNVTTATTMASGTFTHCNGGAIAGTTVTSSAILTPLSMSAPPPLAGLSHTPINAPAASTILTASTLPLGNLSNNIPALVDGVASQSAATITITTPAAAATAATATVTNTSIASTIGIVTTTTTATALTNAATTSNAGIDSHLLGDVVPPSLASAITEVICRGLPKMAPRPAGPLKSDGSTMFPSQAGPVCRTLVENAHKLTDFFISVMEDTMCEMSDGDDSLLQAKNTLLTMELERTKQAYEHEIAELKRRSDLMLCEMRKSMENEKIRLANEIRKQCELERLRSVEETKKKQWCANCGREAQFYCCWNTSYCDYPCQQLHWSRHSVNCAQTRSSSHTETVTTSTTTTAAMPTTVASSQQHDRQNISKSNSSHYNKSSSSNKKEKNSSKGNTITMSGSTLTAAQATEVLKLPSNTYLRALPAGGGNTVRNAPYGVPVQRFNIPLPITAPVNAPPPYTIVQRGSGWELMSTTQTANSGSSPQINTNITTIAGSVPIATPAVQQSHQQQQQHHQQQQQLRLITNSTNASSKGSNNARNRGNAMQSLNANSLQCNVMRSNQM